ncbi:hypothetical protein GGS23DRAFT_553863 [Durotheca rogersii]|uniref:uncharacterized protein n=1 Tax=Durotheca rogersii TaxID=419775 RepID=UPI00221F1843|nr:uncharacterized protein GGS23DRAFT_553863 [Durotheca rogersii]KAI5865705.1 hypothetical protein GGS23DRAFT_553863 [Durotheca rogersii]
MDDPGWSWPAWKFGMKREELFTKLHDQYNTIAFSIQDPEAFHHDVFEISATANTTDEFHRLLADRKQQRLDELNQSLESASVEIIANPSLIGTRQWEHALQLFRTRSMDSLVRYFASYLPDDHPWHRASDDFTFKPFFDEPEDDYSSVTDEPLPITTRTHTVPSNHLPPSPRSLTMCSDGSSSLTAERTSSFSDPETGELGLSTTLSRGFDDDDDETSQSDDLDSPTTSISDISEIISLASQVDEESDVEEVDDESDVGEANEKPMTSRPDRQRDDESESKTPTFRNDPGSVSCLASDAIKLSMSSKYSPLHRRERSPGLVRSRRRSPEVGRVRKTSPDRTRFRPKPLGWKYYDT